MDYKPPLSISFVWDRSDNDGIKEILDDLSNKLSKDPNNPFSRKLDIPTFYFQSTTENSHPASYPSEKAAINVVVAFTSVNTAAVKPWRSYLQEINEQPKFELICVSLDDIGLAHSEELNGLNFLRAYSWPEESRILYASMYILHEVYRFGFNMSERPAIGQNSSIKIFLSHAKVGEIGITHAEAIKAFINETNLTSFFDATSISPGFSFDKEIYSYLASSTVLAIVTDAYSSRFWCQKEILCAKDLNRPIVILNSLDSYEDRAFPELVNSPVVHVHPTALSNKHILEILIACLLETIRQNHVIESLIKLQDIGLIDKCAHVISKPLEYREALQNLDKGIFKYCYPDPPIYSDESSWHSTIGVSASTPLWQESTIELLLWKKIGISISEATSKEEHTYEQGLPFNILTKLAQEIARHLFARSATIVYGGDLRPNGFTEFILNEAVALKSQNNKLKSVVENHLAWPLYLMDAVEVKKWRAKHMDIIETINHLPPEYLEIPYDKESPLLPNTVENSYIWSLSLTNMRRKSIEASNARICAGGKRSNFKGAMPGVLEEILISIEQDKPIFLIGGFGGVVSDVCKLILESTTEASLTEEWQLAQNPTYGKLQEYANQFNRKVDYQSIINTLSALNVEKLSSATFLSVEEYKKLMTTQFIDEAVYLCTKGLSEI